MYYYRARHYNPTLRGFISEDPIGLAAGLNFYAYVQNDPVNFVDPMGLDDTKWYGDGRTTLDGPRNGNWGGKNWSGGHNPSNYGGYAGVLMPTDSADAMYMQHDQCYRRCDLKHNFPSNTCKEDQILNECKKDCNKTLVGSLRRLPRNPAKWDYPPRAGTEEDSSDFRDSAIKYFE